MLPDLDWEVEVEKIVEEIGAVEEALRANDIQRVAHVRHEQMSLLLGRLNDYLGSAISG